MTKRKRKLTPEQKAAKAKRRREYMTIYLNGKQKSVKREPAVDGIPVDEFLRRNADPIFLNQNGMHEELYAREMEEVDSQREAVCDFKKASRRDDELPF
jgi:hypothetical protein